MMSLGLSRTSVVALSEYITRDELTPSKHSSGSLHATLALTICRHSSSLKS